MARFNRFNSFNTRTIRTDKHGQVYYGPKTMVEAERVIDSASPDEYARVIQDVIREMDGAGYTGTAARLRTMYGVKSNPASAYFVVAAPGHYGDTTRVVSSHMTLAAALRAAGPTGSGYVVREGSLMKGAVFPRVYEEVYRDVPKRAPKRNPASASAKAKYARQIASGDYAGASSTMRRVHAALKGRKAKQNPTDANWSRGWQIGQNVGRVDLETGHRHTAPPRASDAYRTGWETGYADIFERNAARASREAFASQDMDAANAAWNAAPKRNPAKAKRKPGPYALFVKKHLRTVMMAQGYTAPQAMKKVAAMWRNR